MIYGIFEESEFVWDNESRELYRKQINSLSDFKKVKMIPHKFKNNKEYYQIKINKKIYYIHRLIYYLYNPDFDIYDSSKDNCIDHRDGNSLNNSIENLNVVNKQQNCQNRKNAKGYLFRKTDNCFQAFYNKDGKEIHKYFSIKKHGCEKAEQLAKQWREEQIKQNYYLG
jgi:hypothetical protein